MILSAILFGATAITVANIIDAFWNDILDFLKKAANKVKKVIKGVLYGSKVFIKKHMKLYKKFHVIIHG